MGQASMNRVRNCKRLGYNNRKGVHGRRRMRKQVGNLTRQYRGHLCIPSNKTG